MHLLARCDVECTFLSSPSCRASHQLSLSSPNRQPSPVCPLSCPSTSSPLSWRWELSLQRNLNSGSCRRLRSTLTWWLCLRGSEESWRPFCCHCHDSEKDDERRHQKTLTPPRQSYCPEERRRRSWYHLVQKRWCYTASSTNKKLNSKEQCGPLYSTRWVEYITHLCPSILSGHIQDLTGHNIFPKI